MIEHELHEYPNVTKEDKILFKDLSYRIIKACIEVHTTLGPGFPEKIYEEATCIEFRKEVISLERQKLIEVYYKGEKIGEYRLDLVVDGKIILELKAVTELNEIFESQLLSYLKATGMKLGILINFGGKKLEFKRIVNWFIRVIRSFVPFVF
jgi:GxxExxY protein